MRNFCTLLLLIYGFWAHGQNYLRSSGGVNNDEALDIAQDAAGNTYTCGYFAATAVFAPGTVTSAGLSDAYLNKRNTLGENVWVKSAGGVNSDRAVSVAVDAAGNAVVTGFFKGTATFGSVTLNSVGGSQDVFVAKYDTNGNVLWAVGFGGSGDDMGYSVALNDAGNIAVAGRFAGVGTIGSVALSSAGGSPDVFVAQLSSLGVVQWAKLGTAPQEDRALGVAIDPSNNVYATGQFSGNITFDNTYNNTVQNAAFLVKFSSAGAETGFVRFAGAQVLSNDLKFTSDGKLAMAGNFVGGLTFFYATPQTFTGTFNDNTFLARMNPDLSMIWFKFESSENEVQCKAVDFDTNGNLYITGTFKCTFTGLNTESGASLWKSLGYRDVFVFRYNTAGTRDQKLHMGGKNDDQCQAITATAGNPIVAGGFEQTFCVAKNPSFVAVLGNSTEGTALTDCPTNTYNFEVTNSVGGRDMFIARALFPGMQPFDFYNHPAGQCQWEHVPYCARISSGPGCCQDAVVCPGQTLEECSYYAFSLNTSPMHPLRNVTFTPGIGVTATGNYTTAFSRLDGCYSKTSTVHATLLTAPQPPLFTSSDGTYTNEPGIFDELFLCDDQVVLSVGSNSPGGTYSWTGPEGVVNSNSIVASESFLYILEYTNAQGCISKHFVQVEFEYQASQMMMDIIPTSGTLSNDTIYLCPGSPLQFTWVNQFDGYTVFNIQEDEWTISPPQPFNEGINATINFVPGEGGYITVSSTLEFIYCPDIYTISKTYYIFIHPSPDISVDIVGQPLICPGESTVLTMQGNLGVVSFWDFPGTINDLYQPQLTVNQPGSYVAVTQLVDVNECYSDAAATFTVSYKPAPTISMNPSNGVICPGQSVTLTAAGAGMTFQWFNPSGTMFSTSAVTTASVPGFYYVIGTDASGCAIESAFSEVYLYASPFLYQFPEDALLCNGQPVVINILATTGSVIQWAAPINSTATQMSLTQPGTYTVSATLCNITETMTINVSNAIEAPSVFVNPDDVLCPGGQLTIYGPEGYNNYSWQPGSIASQNLTIGNPGTFVLVVSTDDGCMAQSAQVQVSTYQVEGTPLPDAIGCFGESLSLSPSTTNTVHWFADNQLTTPLATGTLQTGPITQDASFYYTFTDAFCTSPTQMVNVGVLPLSAPEEIAPAIVCAGETIEIASPTGTATTWLNAGLQPINQDPLVFGPAVESAQFYYFQTDVNDCPTDTLGLMVTVPFVGLTPTIWGDSIVCQGESLTLFTNMEAPTYWWSLPTGFFSTTVPQYTVNTPGMQHTGNYSVSAESGPCTTISNILPVQIIAKPQHLFSENDFTCVSSQLTVYAPEGFDYYYWNGEAGGNFQTFINESQITLLVGNHPGCEKLYVLDSEIPFCPDYLPNIISPNGDGMNEGIDFSEIFGYLDRVLIFNRWGTLILEITSEPFYWDGMMNNGNLCSEGTYFYLIEKKGLVQGLQGFSGYLTVVR